MNCRCLARASRLGNRARAQQSVARFHNRIENQSNIPRPSRSTSYFEKVSKCLRDIESVGSFGSFAELKGAIACVEIA